MSPLGLLTDILMVARQRDYGRMVLSLLNPGQDLRVPFVGFGVRQTFGAACRPWLEDWMARKASFQIYGKHT